MMAGFLALRHFLLDLFCSHPQTRIFVFLSTLSMLKLICCCQLVQLEVCKLFTLIIVVMLCALRHEDMVVFPKMPSLPFIFENLC